MRDSCAANSLHNGRPRLHPVSIPMPPGCPNLRLHNNQVVATLRHRHQNWPRLLPTHPMRSPYCLRKQVTWACHDLIAVVSGLAERSLSHSLGPQLRDDEKAVLIKHGRTDRVNGAVHQRWVDHVSNVRHLRGRWLRQRLDGGILCSTLQTNRKSTSTRLEAESDAPKSSSKAGAIRRKEAKR